jgi:GT2 family glycosyltransferase
MAINPTLAVWMPNFNHSKYIGRAIEAIANQSRRPDAFFIIDDASTDNSREVISTYQKKYPWITAIFNSQNTGVLAIMERGVQELQTDYIVMSSADDYILPGFFEATMRAAQQYPDAGIIFGQMRVEDHEGKQLYTGRASHITESSFLSPTEYRERYLKKEAVTQSLSAASMYKVSALREVGGFRTELGPWCDTFAIQAIALSHGAYYIAQPVSVWVVHNAGVSQGVRKNPQTMLSVINKATQLMQSPPFKKLFPDSYVRMWSLKYRTMVWIQYVMAISPSWLQKWYALVIHKLA